MIYALKDLACGPVGASARLADHWDIYWDVTVCARAALMPWRVELLAAIADDRRERSA